MGNLLCYDNIVDILSYCKTSELKTALAVDTTSRTAVKDVLLHKKIVPREEDEGTGIGIDEYILMHVRECALKFDMDVIDVFKQCDFKFIRSFPNAVLSCGYENDVKCLIINDEKIIVSNSDDFVGKKLCVAEEKSCGGDHALMLINADKKYVITTYGSRYIFEPYSKINFEEPRVFIDRNIYYRRKVNFVDLDDCHRCYRKTINLYKQHNICSYADRNTKKWSIADYKVVDGLW